ncbi:sirohydrochlorin chelatase [Streptomyces sp. H27-H1]|uniref:sirohydrochlorin chelatase n=1 Tax=Streptomyces sp. H27-H1 TaxID=2996461 RepID=UPI0022711F86|nr:CbiX/SirB N-terminal domain-containing protein [Streptomyces sp. H27-H1]MCY0927319.1 sirohydrochlorin chelatase [Streptomyces sp. H27-H1]
MLVIAVHGSAATEAVATIDRLVSCVEAISGVHALVGHLDVQRPSLAEVVREHPHAVVVPLLLGDGFHRRVDIPAVLEGTGCTLTEGLSGERDVARALHSRLRDAERRRGPYTRADAVVVAGAGSSRPGGNAGTEACAAQLAGLLEYDGGSVPVPVVPAYLTSAGPTVPEAVASLRAAGYHRVAVAAHLLAPGRFARALNGSAAWTVSEPLADHPRLARLVLGRYESARGTRALRAARLAC